MDAICLYCTEPFVPSRWSQKYCSAACKQMQSFGPPRACAVCSTVFQPCKQDQKYCSSVCWGKKRRLYHEKTCEYCGKVFRPRACDTAETLTKYCGRECYTAKRRDNRIYTCKECDKEFWRATNPKPPIYCSRTCHLKNIKTAAAQKKKARGGKIYSWRLNVRKRDIVCQECGSGKNLQAHHIKPWEEYPELRFDVDNGILLCRPCHQKHHKRRGVGNSKDSDALRICKECGIEIYYYNKTDYCRRHNWLAREKRQNPIRDLADAAGLNYEMLRGRIRRGWDIDRALTEPVDTAMQRNKAVT